MNSISQYQKAFTRDFTLSFLEIWYKNEALGVKPWNGQKQRYFPYVILHRNDNTVDAYYDERGLEWLRKSLIKVINNDSFITKLVKQLGRQLPLLEMSLNKSSALNKSSFLKFIDNFDKAYPYIEAMWTICEMDEEVLKDLEIKELLKLRNQTGSLSTDIDTTIRQFLMAMYPNLKEYVQVLKIEEVRTDKIPDKENLILRDKEFIYTDNKLFLGSTLKDLENKYNIEIEVENLTKALTIKGNTAYIGKSEGKVRRIMGHKNIEEMQEGEVLVSPMTMPDFLPAMHKACAFVTDEGGITCHAAILARELKKPCIVGTKIATKVLKNGDIVEVDGYKGTVKIIARNNS